MTSDLIRELESLDIEGREAIAAAQTLEQIESARVRLLGRKDGRLTGIMRRMSELSAAEKPAVGAAANRVKNALTELLAAKSSVFEAQAAALAPREDLTMVGRRPWRGAKHPVTLVIDEICNVF